MTDELIKSKVAVFIKDYEGKHQVHVVFNALDSYEDAEVVASIVNELLNGSENFEEVKGTLH
tara:strand:+ start:175 stop:360 length:186 start_codon:yes stop_codon:yes gene_type:complete